MDLHCAVCGKDYWRTQQWMHDKHVVHKPPLVVHKPVVVHQAINAGSSRHGKYADPEKRKAYRKEWMRKSRARKNGTANS